MSFLSAEFLGLAFGAAVFLLGTRGRVRTAGFLAINAYCVVRWLGPWGSLSTLAFCLSGYGLTCWVAQRPARKPYAIAVLVAAFVYMRRYTFLEHVLPRDWLTDLLATAGLSFLFFKLLHVLVDVADGSLKRPPPLHFANYCFNFTSFLLGPIQRFGDFDAQWTGRARSIEPTFEAHLDAVLRVLRGLVKKYVLAEYLHPYALTSEADVAALSAGALLLKTYVFYAFLYCDFSGYCDIVIGVGALIGLRPPENFRLPFLATNVADFWLRVHRSLTLWLTDYVFNPLYASLLRSAALRSQRLLALNAALTGTMLVSGLWHGTTASFVAFGLVHGVYLVVFRTYERVLTGKLGRKRLEAWRSTWVSRALGWTLTFNATAAAYVFFVLDFRSLTALLARLVSP